ncbi:hypothetical protein V5799_017650 [Amblyomma americanum]|uniref:Uncharacterized protein n=1 Tax=Amblyomma americanum TaxID=6943 RepID=A0AAQ4F1J6_AMBAM
MVCGSPTRTFCIIPRTRRAHIHHIHLGKQSIGRHELRVSAGTTPVPAPCCAGLRAASRLLGLPATAASARSGALLRSVGASGRHIPAAASTRPPAPVSAAATGRQLLCAASTANHSDCEGERRQLCQGLLPVCPMHGSLLPLLPGLTRTECLYASC